MYEFVNARRAGTLRICAYPPDADDPLWRDIGRTISIAFPRSATNLLAEVREGSHRYVILDPAALRVDAYAAVVEAVTLSGSHLVFRTQANEAMVARVLEAVQRLPLELVLRNSGEETVSLRMILRAAGTPSTPSQVLRHISYRVQRLPRGIALRVIGLFSWWPLPTNAQEFAKSTRRELRTVERRLEAAGFCGPAQLLQIGRVARAHDLLMQPTTSTGEAAKTVGYMTVASLLRQYRRFFGSRARSGRQELSADDERAAILAHAVILCG